MFTMPGDAAPFDGDNRSPVMRAVEVWQEAKQARINAEAAELAARQLLVALAFPKPTEGTNTCDLGDDYKLKGMFLNRYTLDSKEVEVTLKQLPKAIAANLVKWKADLSLTAFKALEPAHKEIVNKILTVRPGTPSLELIEPKVK